MTRRSRPMLAAIALTTALLATSCSGSDEGDDDTSAEATGPDSPAATAPAVPGPATPSDPTPSDSAATATPAPGSPSAPAATKPATTPAPGTPSDAAPTSAAGQPPAPKPGGALWQPKPGVAWQWQLGGNLDQSVDVPVYDIDGFEHDASVVASLHAKGRKVICYVNAGSWEDFRPDAAAFSKSLQGSGNGWQGEKWFDIRQLDKLKPLMATRFDMCRAKGFDAVEPDLLDAYINKTGFPLTADDQLKYNRMIAALAHERGLAVALKNDLDQIPALVGDFDFAVNEQCAEYDECAKLSPFIKAGKAVLHVEYTVPTSKFCAQAKSLGLSSMEKHLELDAWRQPC